MQVIIRTVRWTDRYIVKQIDRQTNGLAGGSINRQAGKYSGSRQTYIQADRKTDRQTEI